LFACRNQQSLKLYTGFFVPVNKDLNLCLPSSFFVFSDFSLWELPELSRFWLASFEAVTVISRALDSIPVFSSQSKQIRKFVHP
jgi:hypothetical protein